MKRVRKPPKEPSNWALYFRTERLMEYIQALEKRIEELENGR